MSVSNGEVRQYAIAVSILGEAKFTNYEAEPIHADNDPKKMSLLKDKYDEPLNEADIIAIAVSA